MEALPFLLGVIAFVAGAPLKRTRLLAARNAACRRTGEQLSIERSAGDSATFLPASPTGGGGLLIMAAPAAPFIRVF
jgi:hypothetical protein